MSKREKEYKVPSRFQPFFWIEKLIIKLCVKRPAFMSLTGEIPDKAIICSNHAAKMGPPGISIYYPKFAVKWGAHEMLGNYSSRFHYLRDIFYMKKRGFSKRKATFKAFFEAIFSKMIYKGMKFIGTYPDVRFIKTLKASVKVLDADMNVVIFPENSNEGYKTVMPQFFPGFVMLAERYYKMRGEDVPMYPMYYEVKQRLMVVGEPIYFGRLSKEGKSREEIAEIMKDKVNELYFKYVEKSPAPKIFAPQAECEQTPDTQKCEAVS